jgi:hypothetical protein
LIRNLLFFLFAIAPAVLLGQQDSTGIADTFSAVSDTFQHAADLPEIVSPGELQLIPTPLRQTSFPPGWFFLLNCLLLAALVLKFTIFPVYSRNSWNASVNENLFYQLVREKVPVNGALLLLENLFKIYVIAAVLLLVLDMLLPAFEFSAANMFAICLILVVFYIAKHFASMLLAYLTDQAELFRITGLNAVVVTSNGVYLLIPLILVAAYLGNPVRRLGIYVVMTLFSAIVILLIFRALRIYLKARIPFNLQFFLYLCGLEILPYLFLAKILGRNVVN